MYEGGNGALPQVVPICQHTKPVTVSKMLHSDDDSILEESSKHFHFGYDADISNSSIDCNLSMDDGSSDSHTRDFSDNLVHGNKLFVPISEETVCLNSPPVNSIISSSPASVDSWTLYSNNNSSSSDEYSLSSDHANSSSSSNECPSAIELHSRKKKCRKNKFDSDEYVSLESTPSSSNCPVENDSVDVRIIDFAHASFVKKSDDCSKNVHQGPDGGFLTGLNSLKRLLFEINVTEK